MACRSYIYLPGLILLTVAACGGSSDSTSTDSGGGGTTAAVDSTGDTVPDDLAVSSPTSASSSSASLSAKGFSVAKGSSAADKQKENSTLTAGTGECSFTLSMPTATRPACYGPTLKFCNHPNATTSDADCNADAQPGSPQSSTSDDGQLPQGDLGIWGQSEGTKACAAAQVNYLIDDVASFVDNMVKMTMVIACMGEKANVKLPGVNEEVDLKTALADYMKMPGISFTTLTLARLADTSTGEQVYKYTVTVGMTFQGSTAAQTAKIVLKHITDKENKEKYRGKLWATLTDSKDADSNCPSGTTGHTKAIQIFYEKADSTTKFDLDKVAFCGQNAVVSDTFSAADKASDAKKDGWGGNYNWGRFNIDANGLGSLSYAWQAGKGDGFSRVFNVTAAQNTDKSATSTAYFGFGNDIATTAKQGVIKGFFCNWAGPGNQKNTNSTETTHALAQKQVMTRAAAAGSEFISDTTSTKIAFAPTNNCDAGTDVRYYAPTDAQSMTFAADGATDGVVALDNNKTTSASTVTNNLINVNDVTFTQPTAPNKNDI